MLTIAYVRVSTDDQVEHSPEAQRRRCAEFAQSRGLDAPRFLSDEGLSGKNLDRPAMQELIALIEADQVAHLIVWRIDRLSRDSGDLNRLLKLFEKHCVSVHSLSEGNVESVTASGRFNAGLHGLLAQLEREKIVENVTTSMHELIKDGYWLNTPPIGYNLVDNVLVPNDDAHLVRRAFAARAGGASLPEVARASALKYSTARQLLLNRVYLGQVRLKEEWFPGRHMALITPDEFEAAHRGHVPGRRRGSDLPTGRVRCGMCGKLTAIDTNGRGQPIYRCRHRGKGCRIPGRSAIGLHRAARLGIDLLRTDDQLIEAIRLHLARKAQRAGGAPAEPGRFGALASLRRKRDRLLQLFLDDNITEDYFRGLPRRARALTDDEDQRAENRPCGIHGRTPQVQRTRRCFRARCGPFAKFGLPLRRRVGECQRKGTASAHRGVDRGRHNLRRPARSDRYRGSPAARHLGGGGLAGSRYGTCCVGGATPIPTV